MKIIPVRLWSLITVRPRQSQDVGLSWGWDSCKYWQKGSSVPALSLLDVDVNVFSCE